MSKPIEDGLRVAVLGCGRWGRNIVREIAAAGCSFEVADPSDEARLAASRLGALQVAKTWTELSEVDAFFVATPASTHAQVVVEVASAGKPIFVEKPMALSLEDAVSMKQAAGERLFVLHVWRYHPAIRELARIFREQQLGAVNWIRSRRLNWSSPRRDCDSVWTLLPHDLSIFLELTGDLPAVQWAATEPCGEEIVGMVAALGSSPAMIAEVSTRYGEKVREVRLHADKGVAIVHGDRPEIRLELGGGKSEVPEIEVRQVKGGTALQEEIRTCLQYLKGGQPPRSSVDDAILLQTRMHELRRHGTACLDNLRGTLITQSRKNNRGE